MGSYIRIPFSKCVQGAPDLGRPFWMPLYWNEEITV